jgi:hypothetical protein
VARSTASGRAAEVAGVAGAVAGDSLAHPVPIRASNQSDTEVVRVIAT